MAFVYGFSFASLGDDMESTLCTCIVGNLIVVMSWLLFVVQRRRPPQTTPAQNSVEDAVVLLCAYIAFLCGWVLQEWSLPRYNKMYRFATTHLVNAGFVSISLFVRLAWTPCKICCVLMCLRPSATITLDLGD